MLLGVLASGFRSDFEVVLFVSIDFLLNEISLIVPTGFVDSA